MMTIVWFDDWLCMIKMLSLSYIIGCRFNGTYLCIKKQNNFDISKVICTVIIHLYKVRKKVIYMTYGQISVSGYSLQSEILGGIPPSIRIRRYTNCPGLRPVYCFERLSVCTVVYFLILILHSVQCIHSY